MLTTARSRRSAWLAGLAISALTTLAAPAVHAQDLVEPVGDRSCSRLLEDVVIGPGGPGDPIGEPGGPIDPIDPIDPIGEPGGRVAGLFRAAYADPAPAPIEGARAPRSRAATALTLLDPSLRFELTTLGEADVAPHWGKTEFKDLRIRTGLRCVDPESGTWRASISAVQPFEQGVRLLTDVTEVTTALVTATATSTDSIDDRCRTLVKMSDDLLWESSLAGTGVPLIGPLPRPLTPTRYYMEAAVQAHEDVHVKRHKQAIAKPYKRFKDTVEGATITADTRAAAWAQVRSIRDRAIRQFVSDMAPYLNADSHHTPKEFKDAEHDKVAPMLGTIGRWRTFLGCPQVG